MITNSILWLNLTTGTDRENAENTCYIGKRDSQFNRTSHNDEAMKNISSVVPHVPIFKIHDDFPVRYNKEQT